MRVALVFSVLLAVGACNQAIDQRAAGPRQPATDPLVDAWTTAVGGRDRLERFGSWHATGTYQRGGVTGRIDLWQRASGERRVVVTQDVLRDERVFDGHVGWLVDRNREVRELAGFELDDMRADAFVDTWSTLGAGRVAGSITRDGDKLIATADGSRRPDTITLDPLTHRPATMVRRNGEKLRTRTFSDWRDVDGVKFAMHVVDETGNPNRTVTIQWTSVERATPDIAMFKRPMDRAPDVVIANNPVRVPIEIVYGGLIFVKVAVNGTPMSFILDTGAEATVLNTSRLPKLGLKGLGTFATGAGGGDVVVSFVPHVTTTVGDAVVHDQIVAAINLDDLEKPLRRPLDGILGYDFISRFVVEIDYQHQQMRLFDRATYTHPGAGLPMTLEDSTPYIDAVVETPKHEKLTGHFVLDTGCLCDVQLFTPFVDVHGLLAQLPEAKKQGYAAGAGGETQSLSAELPSVTIGSVVVPNPSVDLSRDGAGATADPESAGLIGSVTFGHFVLVLDYKRQRFFLDPVPDDRSTIAADSESPAGPTVTIASLVPGTRSDDKVRQVINARMGIFRACYKQALDKTPGPAGHLTFEIDIPADGAAPVAKTSAREAFAPCVVVNLMRLHFGAGTATHVTLTMSFASPPKTP